MKRFASRRILKLLDNGGEKMFHLAEYFVLVALFAFAAIAISGMEVPDEEFWDPLEIERILDGFE